MFSAKQGYQIIRNMGFRYTMYRIQHEIEKRFGILEKRHPINPSPRCDLKLKDWKGQKASFLIPSREAIKIPKVSSPKLLEDAHRILNGETCFFSADWKNLGSDYDWITNPDTGFRYDVTKHWSKISDLDPKSGDIKYVWEKSRFSYLLTIIRYDYHFDQDHANFVFSEIESWIEANPINQGPNWRCSQEISLRIFNWCFALDFYKNSASLTESRWSKIQHVIYWSLHHVYYHINFSRIAVRNNHAITETLMLTVSELLFPFIPETKEWARKGREWFEEEIAYQIYADGTFLQFSMNYHRVVIQLLSLGIAITERHNMPFSKIVYDRAYKSLNFLYQCLQDENGYLPNYGANDGAWFFQLSTTDYRDYRPQLNTLYRILTSKTLYSGLTIEEDSYWICFSKNTTVTSFPVLKREFGMFSFRVGGYYLIREKGSFTFIRCGDHKDRPGHSDNLHLDIWVDGRNVLRDSGTYKYNTDRKIRDYFSGTAGHNTVMVEEYSQMQRGSRFMTFYWTQSNFANLSETEDSYIFFGEISAFRYLNQKARHMRKVIKTKGKLRWQIVDHVYGLPGKKKFQLWHHDDYKLDIVGALPSGEDINYLVRESFNSEYYGLMAKGKSTALPFDTEVSTMIELKN